MNAVQVGLTQVALMDHAVSRFSLGVGVIVTILLVSLLVGRLFLRELQVVVAVRWARVLDLTILFMLIAFVGIVGARFDVLH